MKIQTYNSTNRSGFRAWPRLLFIIAIVLLLQGCAAVAAVPLPLKIASNLHTAITIAHNLDEDPENDGLVVDTVREMLPEGDSAEVAVVDHEQPINL